MDTRREVLKKMFFGATVTALPVGAVVAGAAAASANTAPGSIDMNWLEAALQEHPEARKWMASLGNTPTAPAPWELVAPLKEGSLIGLGWHVAALSPVQLGAAILTLRHDKGHQAYIHISRNDGSPVGITHTQHFDLVVMNGGDGDQPSDENLGRVVVTIGNAMTKNESGGNHQELAEKMLSHSDRTTMFGPESLLA